MGLGAADGAGSAASFNHPQGIATDAADNVYVADTGNRALRKITPAGVVSTLTITDAAGCFVNLRSVTLDRAGLFYVTNGTGDMVCTAREAGSTTLLAGVANLSGEVDAQGNAARFSTPHGVVADGAGNLYIAEQSGRIRKITPAGEVTTLAGGKTFGEDGTGTAAGFGRPMGMTLDPAGTLYVADNSYETIRKVTLDGVVTTLAGSSHRFGSDDGTGAAAQFASPSGVSVDSAGNAFVADQANNSIRRITPDGVVTTFAGMTGVANSGSTDGTGPTARFNRPTGITIDPAGNLYVVDAGNATIRKVTSEGVVTTIAGTANKSGNSDGIGAAARFNAPTGIAIDSAGNLYVADTGNALIRKLTPAGVVTTIAGISGVRGIVLGTAPRLGTPLDLTVVGDRLIVSDSNAVLVLRQAVR